MQRNRPATLHAPPPLCCGPDPAIAAEPVTLAGPARCPVIVKAEGTTP